MIEKDLVYQNASRADEDQFHFSNFSLGLTFFDSPTLPLYICACFRFSNQKKSKVI